MIHRSAVHVRLLRAHGTPGTGMVMTVERETPFNDLPSWPDRDVSSIDVGFPIEVTDDAPILLVDQLADALRGLLRRTDPTTLLLSVEHPDLVDLAWEDLERQLGWQVVRYTPIPAPRAFEPVELPLSVLLVDVGDTDDRFDVVSRYFRSVTAGRQSAAGVAGLIASQRFDVVHLGVRDADPAAGPDADEVRHADGSAIDVEGLSWVLDQANARLLILESLPSAFGYNAPMTSALRAVGHRLHTASGVAVLVSGPATFRSMYYDLTHDRHLTDLVYAVEPLSPEDRPALWLRQGGDGVLRLLGAGARMNADVVHEHLRVVAAHDAQLAESTGDIEDSLAEQVARDTIDRLVELRERTYSFDQESLGVEPMAVTRQELGELQQLRADRIPEPGRVLDGWIQSDGRTLPPYESLEAASAYQLAVTIARPRPGSAAAGRPGVDGSMPPDAYIDGAADLTVVVSSNDVVVGRARTPLRLPPPPADSEIVLVPFTTVAESGSCRVRIGIHHRSNLLQSLLLTATVGAPAAAGPGYSTELEWAMSSTFRGLDELEEPSLSIVTNEDPRGSHTFVVYAAGDAAESDIHRQLDIAPGQLKTAVDDARTDLQAVCATFRNGELHRYRYADGRADRKRLLDDLKNLALAGSGLFAELTLGADAAFHDQLENRLRGSRLIQIAAVRSANYVFPWSLVYDHEFRLSPKNALCSVAANLLDDDAAGEGLAQSLCFVDECPERGDANVVCPSGFWGFRHRIEQPLLTAPAIAFPQPDDDEVESEQDRHGGSPRYDAPTLIRRFGADLNLAIGVSETLSGWEPHADSTAAQFSSPALPTSSIGDLIDQLRRIDLHVAYFYCHGGRRGAKPFLGLGTRREVEELYPQYLRRLDWPDLHPFVFINGCRTVGVGPDDLLSFTKVFAQAQASGLLGTEIAVPEPLAQFVADGFFRRFASGEQIGHIIRQVRLDLLAQGNPLGLAYTPYCMASLRLSA